MDFKTKLIDNFNTLPMKTCLKIALILQVFLFAFESFAQDEAMQIFSRAEHLRKSNNFIAAIDEYERALALEPENPRFAFSKGMCYMTLKEFDNAVLAFEETSKLKSDFVPAYTMMAKCYQNLERYLRVEESLDQAFRFETDLRKRVKYKEVIINMFYKQENFDRALKHINDVKVIDPNILSILHLEASINNKKGNYSAAKQAMISATTILPSKDPKSVAKYYYELGYAYNKLGEYENSAQAFKLANFGPYKSLIARLSPAFYTSLATCHIKIKNYDKGKEYLETALKMQNTFSHAYVLKAQIAKMEADQTKAINEYKEAAKVETDRKKLANIYAGLAELQLDNGLYNDAIISADEFLKLDNKNYQVKFTQAIAHYKNNNFKQAINILEMLVGYPGLDVENKSKFQFALAMIYKDMNNTDRAKIALKASAFGSFSTISKMELEEITSNEKKEEVN